MKFFDNVYDFVAKKWAMVFAIIGFAAFEMAIIFEFIGGFVGFADGGFGYFVLFSIKELVLAGLVFGFFFKNKKLLITSFVAFITLMVYIIVGGRSEIIGVLYGDNGADVTFAIFGLIYAIAFAFFVLILVFDYVFDFKKLNFLANLSFFIIFATGLAYWITGIVYAAAGANANWTNALIPLFQCASFLFIPAVLALINEETAPLEESPVPEATVENTEVVEPEKLEEEVIEDEVVEAPIEEAPKEEKPAPKEKAPSKKAPAKKPSNKKTTK